MNELLTMFTFDKLYNLTIIKITCFNSMMKAADKSALPEGSVITLLENQFF